jgi:hypothetical protein
MRTGSLIAGRYQIERQAGSGGMGAVYRALDGETGTIVAVKILRTDALYGRDDVQRFAREASLLAELSHPGIVHYLGHGVTADNARYLVMEWLEGKSLSQRLTSEDLSVAESVAVARQAAEALGAAHGRGVIHRDVKPSNMMFVGGATERFKLIDFGIARRLDATSVTRTGTIVGSPGYMSPEQVRGTSPVGPSADVFALGCVLYECLTGRRAFSGLPLALLTRILCFDPPPVAQLCPEVPQALSWLVMRMLAKEPEARPRDGAEVAAALAALGPMPDLIGQRTAATSGGVSRDPETISHASRSVHMILAADTGTRPSLLQGAEDADEETRKVQRSGRALHVILAGEAGNLPGEEAAPAAPEAGCYDIARLREAMQPFGAHIEVLPDGAVIAILPGAETPARDSVRAAECALVLRGLLPEVPMVLLRKAGPLQAPAVPVAPEVPAVDDELDEAVRALAAEDMNRLFAGAAETSGVMGGIRLDTGIARLLPAMFALHHGSTGVYLVGKRDAS